MDSYTENVYDKILIITGGSLNTNWATSYLAKHKFDYIIAADSGLNHLKELGLKPDFILGDYDSVNKDILESFKNENIKTYPRHKDYTDTHLAIITAIKLGPKSITIMGATGTRLDHTLTSIGNLKGLIDLDIEAKIIDPNNKIYLLGEGQSHTIKREEQYGDYVSFYPLGDSMIISLKGFYYPLNKAEVKTGLSLTQSNEICEDEAIIKLHKGIAIVIEARD